MGKGKCSLGSVKARPAEICEAASEVAYHVDEVISMAVDAERERCIRIVQFNYRANSWRRKLVALLRSGE